MKKIILGLILAGLAACATEANYVKKLDALVGSPESALIDAWGVPSGVYETGGVRYLAYRRDRSVTVPGIAPSYHTTVIGDTAYTTVTGGTGPSTYTNSCETTFKIRAGRVEGYSYRGDGCKSRE